MKTKIQIRIPKSIHERMIMDLQRPHDFAYERIGFLYAKTVPTADNSKLVLGFEYIPVDDENYIDDPTVGAKINATAIRKAMQGSLDMDCGCFHVHMHKHKGKPFPSLTDSKSNPGLISGLSNAASKYANGVIILSNDGFYTEVKIDGIKKPIEASAISVVGDSLAIQFDRMPSRLSGMFDRQSFLGSTSSHIFNHIRVGIVGYGGGGSHIGQQLAHLGVRNIMIFDYDQIESSNLNRLVGGTSLDVEKGVAKTAIAKRTIKGIIPSAKPVLVQSKWQETPEMLRSCDVIFGCVDSYTERDQLEGECRRFLIPLIDIGMDVHKYHEEYSMSGQVIVSTPEKACMRCVGFLTEEKLALEAAKYGAVGGRPQVVWPNGVLASTAVGLFVNMVTGWSKISAGRYLVYDGNTGKIEDHVRSTYAPTDCSHFKITHTGTPNYSKL